MSTDTLPGPIAIYPPIRRTVLVAATPEHAFRRFTVEMGSWWPLRSHSIGQRDSETVVMEGRVGGRIVEKVRGGKEAVWGTVTAWEPPRRVAFTWHPGHNEAEAQDVEVCFSAEGEFTFVELEHSGFERLGKLAKRAYRGYPMGWDYVLGLYAERRGFYQLFLKTLTGALMFLMRLFKKS